MEDVQAQSYLGPDSIIFVSAGSPMASPPRHDDDGMPPESLLDAIFLRTLATWQATLDFRTFCRKKLQITIVLIIQQFAMNKGHEVIAQFMDHGDENDTFLLGETWMTGNIIGIGILNLLPKASEGKRI